MRKEINREELNRRLKEIFEVLKARGIVHSQTDLANRLEMRVSNLNDAFNLAGRAMTQGLLNKIGLAFPDILNPSFIETGEGPVQLPPRSDKPHIGQNAAAGAIDALSIPDTGRDLRSPASFFQEYDFTMTASGNSMEPLILSGDILCCRFANDRFNIPYDRVCVIDRKSGPVVKVLRRDGDRLIAHSINPDVPDFDLDPADILSIARVTNILHTL